MVTLTVVVVILSVAGCSIFLTTAEPSDGAAESAQTSDPAEDKTLPTDIGTNTPDPLPEAANRTEPDSARSDTETAPDNEPALDRTEVYDEITDNGVTFQARWGAFTASGKTAAKSSFILFSQEQSRR